MLELSINNSLEPKPIKVDSNDDKRVVDIRMSKNKKVLLELIKNNNKGNE